MYDGVFRPLSPLSTSGATVELIYMLVALFVPFKLIGAPGIILSKAVDE